jgi:hypothetical protein
MESFSRVRSDRLQIPRVQFSARVAPKSLKLLPVLKLNHLHRLTDDIGMFQHSIFTVPNYGEGYTVDDNARALVFTASLARTMSDELGDRKSTASASSLDASSRYLSFLEHAFNPVNGRFKNFLTFDRRWNESEGSEDCHGRALWALGTVLGRSMDEGLRSAAGRLFEFSLPAVVEFRSPRAWAYALIGIHEYLTSYPGDRDAQKIQSVLSRRLLEMYEAVRTPDWQWFEDVLAYGNARLPQAMLLVGAACSDARMIAVGLESLNWLLTQQQCEINGHFVPIGSQGFYRRGGDKARFDQQPIEAAGAVSACLQAYRITGDRRWRDQAWSAFNRFQATTICSFPL